MHLPAEAILYIGDPMCSWCYGFNPVLGKVEEVYGDRIPLKAVMGGLRPGELAEPLDARLSKFLRHHWKQVQEATGQPFNYDFLDREGFVYDTEPSCRAVVSFRNFLPQREFAFFSDVQSAFYRDGEDPCEADTFVKLAESYDLDGEKYREFFNSDEARYQTNLDFQLGRSVGVTGFPALVHLKDQRAMVISYGYTPFDQIQDVMDNLILKPATGDSRAEPADYQTGDACDIDSDQC
ncbi:MAG TPA: DsbA family protein [Leptospiraceae bacterium]|nr:DsbA family protein [Leptospiraceae bacterium]